MRLNTLEINPRNRVFTRLSGQIKPRLKRKIRVTLIVGIICKDSIVVAADSQMSYGQSGRIRTLDTNKINTIEFTNQKVLVAESGMATLSNIIIDRIQSKANQKQVENEETIINTVQEAVREIRNEQTSLYPPNAYTVEELKRYFRDDSPVELTVGYYYHSKPYLYTITLDECTAHKARGHYAVSGCGGELGEYLLTQYSEPGMDASFGSVIALKVAAEVSKYVEGCGEPLKASIIREPYAFPNALGFGTGEVLTEVVMNIHPEKIQEMLDLLNRVDIRLRKTQKKQIYGELSKLSQKFSNGLYKAFDKFSKGKRKV